MKEGQEPFTLLVNDSQVSQEAMRLLKERGIPFYPFKTPEVNAPYLITPVGSFKGEKIGLYTESFHKSVIDYLARQ